MAKHTKGLMARTPPMMLPETSVQEVQALKALANGEASEVQQDLIFKYIVMKLGMVGGQSIFHGQHDVTAFNEGRRFVGINVIHLVETPMDILKQTCITMTKQEKENDDRTSSN